MKRIRIPLWVKLAVLFNNIIQRFNWVKWKHSMPINPKRIPTENESCVQLDNEKTIILVDNHICQFIYKDLSVPHAVVSNSKGYHCIILNDAFVDGYTPEEQEYVINDCLWKITNRITPTYKWWDVTRLITDQLACDNYLSACGHGEQILSVLKKNLSQEYNRSSDHDFNNALLKFRLRNLTAQ